MQYTHTMHKLLAVTQHQNQQIPIQPLAEQHVFHAAFIQMGSAAEKQCFFLAFFDCTCPASSSLEKEAGRGENLHSNDTQLSPVVP